MGYVCIKCGKLHVHSTDARKCCSSYYYVKVKA